MSDLAEIRQFLKSLPRASERHAAEARQKQRQLTKPPGSLGRLEDLAVQLAAFQAAEPSARPAFALHFACDHPVARHGVGPYPQEVTRAMVSNFVHGGAASSVLCRLHQLPLVVLDVGVMNPPSEARIAATGAYLERLPVADLPAGDISCEDALDEEGFTALFDAGRRALSEHAPGARVVLLGEMGIGNTTVSAAVLGALLSPEDPARFVGMGTGASGDALARKRELVSQAVRRLEGDRDPLRVLRRVGGRELVALLGAMSEALQQRAAVLVDGFILSTVALVLCQLAPWAKDGLVFAHCSAEEGHRLVLEHLKGASLLQLGMRLGEGSGALTAFPLLEAAARLHQEMATFASAGVPEGTSR